MRRILAFLVGATAMVTWVLLSVAVFAASCGTADAGAPDRYRVSPSGRFIAGQMGHADVPVARVPITAEIAGEVDEPTWCIWARVTWPDGTQSGNESDCPPWEDWQKSVREAEECEAAVVVVPAGEDDPERDCPRPYAPQRRWQWVRWFPAGQWSVRVDFLYGSRVIQARAASFTIPGAEERRPW